MPGLTISRKTGQSFTVGEAVITIRKIKGNRAVVQIVAPLEVQIIRGQKKNEARESLDVIANDSQHPETPVNDTPLTSEIKQ